MPICFFGEVELPVASFIKTAPFANLTRLCPPETASALLSFVYIILPHIPKFPLIFPITDILITDGTGSLTDVSLTSGILPLAIVSKSVGDNFHTLSSAVLPYMPSSSVTAKLVILLPLVGTVTAFPTFPSIGTEITVPSTVVIFKVFPAAASVSATALPFSSTISYDATFSVSAAIFVSAITSPAVLLPAYIFPFA